MTMLSTTLLTIYVRLLAYLTLYRSGLSFLSRFSLPACHYDYTIACSARGCQPLPVHGHLERSWHHDR